MLVLQAVDGESLHLSCGVTIKVMQLKRGRGKIAVDAPMNIKIVRGAVLRRLQLEEVRSERISVPEAGLAEITPDDRLGMIDADGLMHFLATAQSMSDVRGYVRALANQRAG